MAISDETLALAIPSELKSDHPDSALVVEGIAIALAACENSSAMTARGRMKEVHAALKSVYVPIFQAHLQKEDEDWGALKAKADKYVPNVVLSYQTHGGNGDASFRYSGAESGHGVVHRDWIRDDEGYIKYGGYAASVTPTGGMPSQWVQGDTPFAAVRALFSGMGLTVERIDRVKGTDEKVDPPSDIVPTAGASVEEQLAGLK